MTRESRKYDVRTMERFLREGRISEEEYEKHLEALPDVAEKAEAVEAEFVQGILEEEEEEN